MVFCTVALKEVRGTGLCKAPPALFMMFIDTQADITIAQKNGSVIEPLVAFIYRLI